MNRNTEFDRHPGWALTRTVGLIAGGGLLWWLGTVGLPGGKFWAYVLWVAALASVFGIFRASKLEETREEIEHVRTTPGTQYDSRRHAAPSDADRDNWT